jgi:hypothetical protein
MEETNELSTIERMAISKQDLRRQEPKEMSDPNFQISYSLRFFPEIHLLRTMHNSAKS